MQHGNEALVHPNADRHGVCSQARHSPIVGSTLRIADLKARRPTTQRLMRAALAALMVMACALPVRATTVGVYFVHGKGDANLAVKSNAWYYWDSGRFMTTVTLGSSNGSPGCGVPTDFAAYNGTYRLEDAAFGRYYWDGWTQGGGYYYDGSGPGVEEQLANFIRQWGISDLIIVAHSMGGNVIREILSNSEYWNFCSKPSYNGTWDPNCVAFAENQRLVQSTTKAVFAIAVPFTGSEAADLANQLRNSWPPVSWITKWLSGGDPSTVACGTKSMAHQNATWLFGTAGRGWPANNPARTATWVQMASWNYPSQMANDYLHPEDGGLVAVAGLVPFADNLSDGLVSWTSQRAVGTANTGPPPGGTLFRNNHFHAKGQFGLSETCDVYGWSGGCYPPGPTAGCQSYLGTCPYNTSYLVPPSNGNFYNCLARSQCIGQAYGEDEAVRIQNTVWAYSGQRCGFIATGCGILACRQVCPAPFC